MLVSMCRTLTGADGRTAPDGSVTRPRMLPDEACPCAGTGHRSIAAVTKISAVAVRLAPDFIRGNRIWFTPFWCKDTRETSRRTPLTHASRPVTDRPVD